MFAARAALDVTGRPPGADQRRLSGLIDLDRLELIERLDMTATTWS